MTTNGLKDVRCTSQICRRNISVTVANKFAARLVLAWTLHIIENRIGIILIFPHSSPFLHDLQWHNLGQVALKKPQIISCYIAVVHIVCGYHLIGKWDERYLGYAFQCTTSNVFL